jgi:hypothetical protein
MDILYVFLGFLLTAASLFADRPSTKPMLRTKKNTISGFNSNKEEIKKP